jgi:hypothetical protein
MSGKLGKVLQLGSFQRIHQNKARVNEEKIDAHKPNHVDVDTGDCFYTEYQFQAMVTHHKNHSYTSKYVEVRGIIHICLRLVFA